MTAPIEFVVVDCVICRFAGIRRYEILGMMKWLQENKISFRRFNQHINQGATQLFCIKITFYDDKLAIVFKMLFADLIGE